MVEHDPTILKVTAGLHALHQVHTTPWTVHGHLENKYLSLVLTWKLILVDENKVGVVFEFENAIRNSSLLTEESLCSRYEVA